MKQFLRRVLFILIFSVVLLSQFRLYASHVMGAELFYTHVSGNTYKITCVVYGDCSPAAAAGFSTFPTSQPQVCVYDASISTSSPVATLSLPIQAPDSGIEATTLCPGDTSQCFNPASPIPGVMKFVYSGNVTLPHASTLWLFVYTGGMGPGSAAGRASSITNINSAGATLFQLIDTLNNSLAPNSSPTFSDTLQTTFCINQQDRFDPKPIDPEGDSMDIILTNAMNGSGGGCTIGGPVSYRGTAWPGTPVSAINPLQVLPDSFQLNHRNGQLSFFPNVSQRANVLYNVREFRGGVLVGTSQHEFNFLITTCPGTFPCLINSCAGTPEAGNVSATPDIGCSSFVSILSLPGSTLATGLTYQWQSSPDSSTWTNIFGATNETMSTTVSVSGYYRATVSCATSTGNDTSPGLKIFTYPASIPIVSINATPGTSIIAGQYDTLTATVTGGVAPTFQWLINGSVIPGATTSVFIRNTFADHDSVVCRVTNTDLCAYSSFNVVFLNVSGAAVNVDPVVERDRVTLAPNPTKGFFTISGKTGATGNEKITVEIANTLSQVVYEASFVAEHGEINQQMDVSRLPNGLYFLKINGVTIKRFLKE